MVRHGMSSEERKEEWPEMDDFIGILETRRYGVNHGKATLVTDVIYSPQ